MEEGEVEEEEGTERGVSKTERGEGVEEAVPSSAPKLEERRSSDEAAGMEMKDGAEETGEEVERGSSKAGELEAREVDRDPGMVSLHKGVELEEGRKDEGYGT